MTNLNIIENILQNLNEVKLILEEREANSLVIDEQQQMADLLSQALSNIWLLETINPKQVEETKLFDEQKDCLRKALLDLREELSKENSPTEETFHEEEDISYKETKIEILQEEELTYEEEEEILLSETVVQEIPLPPPPPITDKFPETYTPAAIVDVFSIHDEDEPALATPINSIAETIGIIDKFLFIKELFDNNENEFRQAVAQLDNMENLEQAQNQLAQMFPTIDKNNYAFKQFGNLVIRRYKNC